LLAAASASAFVSGLCAGLIGYLDRSPVREHHSAGTSAWGVHIGLFLLAAALVLLIAYGWFRVGMQVLGGLGPNFTANAWGGPSYLGAMACHYLDCGLIMAVAAGALDLVLVSSPTAISGKK
jgi:hypothetical protein